VKRTDCTPFASEACTWRLIAPVATLFGAGWYMTADGAVSEPALAVDVVEPTGAGDAFAAGYLAGTLHGFDERRRLRLGHLAAASALVAHGDVGELGDLSRLGEVDPAGPLAAADHDGQWSAAAVAALLDAPEEQWRATRISTDGIAFGMRR